MFCHFVKFRSNVFGKKVFYRLFHGIPIFNEKIDCRADGDNRRRDRSPNGSADTGKRRHDTRDRRAEFRERRRERGEDTALFCKGEECAKIARQRFEFVAQFREGCGKGGNDTALFCQLRKGSDPFLKVFQVSKGYFESACKELGFFNEVDILDQLCKAKTCKRACDRCNRRHPIHQFCFDVIDVILNLVKNGFVPQGVNIQPLKATADATATTGSTATAACAT